jgi:hypothetical protein
MTDAQLVSLLAAFATVGGSVCAAIRWAVVRMVKSQDGATSAMLTHAKDMADNAASNRELANEIRDVILRIDAIGEFVEETTGNHDIEAVRRKLARAKAGRRERERAITPPKPQGYYGIHRQKNDTDKED